MTLRHRLISLTISGAALLTGGCSLMHDDLPPCPSGVDLCFVYDYNIQRADMFNAHVGSVTVYVFDADGRYIMSREEYNTPASAPLADHAYRMHLDLAPGTYRFIAVGHQRAYDECLSSPGAKYRRSTLAEGIHNITDLEILLDREAGRVNHGGTALDVLWHGMSDTPLVVRDMEKATRTISLMRDTKELTVSLHQLDNPADIDIDDYDMAIVSDNGRIGHDNSLLPDEQLTYTPYTRWNTEFTTGSTAAAPARAGVDVLERTAHAALSFNRLWHYAAADENSRNAILTITRRDSGKEVARINLPDCLSQGRGAFAYNNYSEQEFLDREYDYKLDFFLRGDQWQYLDLSISIVSWSKRIQRVEF